MILVDLSQIMLATIFENIKIGLEKPLAKSMIYMTLLSYKKKFGNKYGEMVLCADSRDGYWRRDIFEHYKAHRKKNRENSNFDWDAIFDIINEVTVELEECCPWKFVRVSKAEADDVIAVLAMKYGNTEPVLIISTDKDFAQLQHLKFVEQFSPTKKKFIKTNPDTALMTLILEGDAGDGIPNMLSDGDTFVTEGKRQKPITRKIREEFFKDPNSLIAKYSENFERNKKLIDFTEIPEQLQESIVDEFLKESKGSINKMYQLLVKNRMLRVLESIEHFEEKNNVSIHSAHPFFQ